MKIYGAVAGIIHREMQTPPEAFCARCGKSVGPGWGRALCAKCTAATEKPPESPVGTSGPPPAGMRRCNRCRHDKPEVEFKDAKGRYRVCCSECRKAAAKVSAAKRDKNRKEGR